MHGPYQHAAALPAREAFSFPPDTLFYFVFGSEPSALCLFVGLMQNSTALLVEVSGAAMFLRIHQFFSK